MSRKRIKNLVARKKRQDKKEKDKEFAQWLASQMRKLKKEFKEIAEAEEKPPIED